jgi:carbonic anhydrase
MTLAHEALERLRAGNRRFVWGVPGRDAFMAVTRRGAVVAAQHPFAVVLGCSDSRVPVEIVFDQGVGDLFVIRVAGNIVGSSQIGSVEFAVERLGTRLVVVLGHTGCGAVQATLDELERPGGNRAGSLHSIVDRIRPAVEGLLTAELRHDRAALARHAVRANVRVAVAALRGGSEILAQRIRDDGLLVLGAEYALETGEVEFFCGEPGRSDGS